MFRECLRQYLRSMTTATASMYNVTAVHQPPHDLPASKRGCRYRVYCLRFSASREWSEPWNAPLGQERGHTTWQPPHSRTTCGIDSESAHLSSTIDAYIITNGLPQSPRWPPTALPVKVSSARTPHQHHLRIRRWSAGGVRCVECAAAGQNIAHSGRLFQPFVLRLAVNELFWHMTNISQHLRGPQWPASSMQTP